MSTIKVNDRFAVKDRYGAPMPKLRQGGFWARTEVIGGYGDIITKGNGLSTLGEVLFRQHNIVPIGGTSYAMQKLFEIPETQIDIPTLYSETGIGLPDTSTPTEVFQTPIGDRAIQYRHGHYICCFGVGITGTAENDVTVYNPDYREYSINISKVTTDGLTVTGTMLPFRYTAETLSTTERLQYFGKLVSETDVTGYYLKTFESVPTIKHIWKTGEEVLDEEEEELVASSDVWQNIAGLNSVESCTEIVLKIGKKDIKEWFQNLEQEDRTRINTIALFDGRFVKDESDPTDDGDFEDVRMFSKLCINPEYLTLNKDLHIIYRCYTS